MEFSEIYERVFEINPSLKDKIEIEGKDFCVINFHEYLTVGFDDDYIDINHGFTHAHFGGTENKLFFDIIQGNMFFCGRYAKIFNKNVFFVAALEFENNEQTKI